MIYIIAISFAFGGNGHSDISFYRWISSDNNKPRVSSPKEMITYISISPHTVFVKDDQGEVEVVVVDANPPYLRTMKDGRLTNNLLNLPRF